METPLTQHLVLWDGECEFCRRATSWAKKHDFHAEFAFSPYQSQSSTLIAPEIIAACQDAVHVVSSDGKVLRAGRATLFILERIGWGWFARLLSVPPFIWLIEIAYRIVASHRDFFARFLFRNEANQ